MRVCSLVRSLTYVVGAEYIENGWRQRLGPLIGNDIMLNRWSRDRRCHVTRCGRAALRAPGGGFGIRMFF